MNDSWYDFRADTFEVSLVEPTWRDVSRSSAGSPGFLVELVVTSVATVAVASALTVTFLVLGWTAANDAFRWFAPFLGSAMAILIPVALRRWHSRDHHWVDSLEVARRIEHRGLVVWSRPDHPRTRLGGLYTTRWNRVSLEGFYHHWAVGVPVGGARVVDDLPPLAVRSAIPPNHPRTRNRPYDLSPATWVLGDLVMADDQTGVKPGMVRVHLMCSRDPRGEFV